MAFLIVKGVFKGFKLLLEAKITLSLGEPKGVQKKLAKKASFDILSIA